MKQVIILNKKGQDQMLTTIFVIVIILVSVLFMIKYLNDRTIKDIKIQNQLMRYDLVFQAKDYIKNCYGNPLVYNPDINCSVPYGEGDILIQGYKITQLEFAYCTKKTFINKKPKSFNEEVIFVVPIKNKNINCIGEIKIYI
jgi:hypothetical protein